MAHVLGNEAVEMRKGDRGLLEPFRELLDAAASGPLEDTDLHTNGLVVLSKLSQVVGEGYPGFMSSKAWPTKTANTQMGAWSQTEHAVYLYAKDTAVYPSAYDDETRFHGYVEPVPAYYAALWSLVHRTRTAFEELGIFERIAGLETRSREDPLGRSAVVPTPEHFTTLEDVLLKLKGMSEKELEGKPFDESENALLKSFGWKLKYLSFNESTSAHAREPMAIVVRIAREYLEKKGLYVGVGRPLAVYVVVPWMGTLQWAKGGVYSYYEFMRLSLIHI